MSGGMLGGGDAWARDHEEILEHARGLGYDRLPGVSLPPADAPKETWISEMDKFNAWKASELAKPEASRWWVTRPWTPLEGTVSPEGGGGSVSSGSASVARPTASPIAGNPYYPMLVQEYEAPGLVDYSAYMPADSLFGYEQYQPWVNPNSIDSSIFNYQPPTIYATDPRISLGDVAYTRGVGGRIMPTRPMGGGEFGIEDGSSSSSSSDAYDPSKDVVPGTKGVTVQNLFDYEQKDISSPIYNEDGVQEPRYFVPPDMRADIVRADINQAAKQAYLNSSPPPLKLNMGPTLKPEEVAKGFDQMIGSDYVNDQVQNEIARVINEIKFRPRSREEASQGPTGASPSGSGVNRGHPSGDASFGGSGVASGGGHAYGADGKSRGN